MFVPSPAPAPFSCEVDPDHERVVVRPCGELDLSTVDDVDGTLRDLRAAGFDRLVVDLAGLTFVDSSGLSLLLRWARFAAQDGVTLELRPGSPEVMRVFEIAGTADALPFVASGRSGRAA